MEFRLFKDGLLFCLMCFQGGWLFGFLAFVAFTCVCVFFFFLRCLWLFISHPLHSQFLSVCLLRLVIGFMRLLRFGFSHPLLLAWLVAFSASPFPFWCPLPPPFRSTCTPPIES